MKGPPPLWFAPLCGSLVLFGELLGCAAATAALWLNSHWPAAGEFVKAALGFSK